MNRAIEDAGKSYLDSVRKQQEREERQERDRQERMDREERESLRREQELEQQMRRDRERERVNADYERQRAQDRANEEAAARERARRAQLAEESAPARPLLPLANLASPERTFSEDVTTRRDAPAFDSAGELVPQTIAVAHSTTKVLISEMAEQIRFGEDVSVREAARSGIRETVDESVRETVESEIRDLIRKLPEEQSFKVDVFYSTFVDPDTRMITPYSAARNVSAYFEQMVGKRLREFFEATNP
ncbi:MAG: hypothetical protein JNK68_04330 [Betaproteobacteria bacterium]|nr:hypothetical protein [Betaproteobacteria bacterium]